MHTDHLEFPRVYRAWRVNSFQGHETCSKTMHHVKSVTELRIASRLDTAAFNWVTRYNLSCGCFNPVFNPPLSLSLSPRFHKFYASLSFSLSPFSRFFVGFLAITSREIATRAVSPKTRLQLAESHPLDDWNKRGREGNLFFFFFLSCWYLADVFGFGRCSALLLIFSYRKNPRINGYALVCARILFWCGCNFRGEIFNGRTLEWRRMRGR